MYSLVSTFCCLILRYSGTPIVLDRYNGSILRGERSGLRLYDERKHAPSSLVRIPDRKHNYPHRQYD